MGWGLLGFLCKLSVNPETCILRSAESFYKRGKATLLFAKFIPGINTMAPPLAGSMQMPLDIFCGWIWRERRCTPRFTLPSDFCSAIFWFPSCAAFKPRAVPSKR